MKARFLSVVFTAWVGVLCSFASFAQGGDTPAAASGSPVTVPFSAAGSTVSAVNNVDGSATPGTVTIDGGNDWFYYFCAPSTGVIYITVTYNGAASPQIFPSLQVFTDAALTMYAGTPGNAAASVGATPSTANTANTIGVPLAVTAGQCYYVMLDNYNYNTSGYTYTLSMTYSTTTTTPPLQPGCTNMGFDAGSTTGWVGNWGHSVVNGGAGAPTPTYTPVYGTLNQGHHNVTTAGLDAFTGAIQKVCPLIPGNSNSLMLGDGANASFGGAQITQKFSVTSSNALLTYYYAAVMQDAGADHQNYEQPFFKIEALDCSGNPIACGNYLVTGGPGIPGFIQIGTSTVYYKDWTPVLLDLTPYVGSCVTIRFTIGDCSRGAHFAYAYLDATCGPLQITTPPSICQYGTSTLTAPTGAATYSWVNTANPGTVLGTTNTLSITPTTTGTFTYQCTMTSVTGCNSTVSSTITVLPTPQITVTNPPAVCSPNTVNITSSSVVTVSSGSGTLSYFQDAACTIPIANPSAITTSGTYYIKITNANGCYDIKPVTVVVNTTPSVNVTTADQTICSGQSVALNATVGPAAVNTPMTFNNTADYAIPDGTSSVSSPITVSGVTQQTPGVLPIVSVCVNLTHTWDEDIQMYLQCPNGTQIQLSTGNGLDGDNYTNTCFVPTGAPSILTGAAPFSGSFMPEQAFSTLNACAVNGTWNLVVSDNYAGDIGTILDWSITFNSYTPAPTYAWSPTTNMTNSTTLTPTVTPTATTTYTLTATSSVGGCTASDPVTITVNPLPTATISGTTTVCQNSTPPTITFTGANGSAPYTFTYNINGGANQTVSSGAGTTATVSAPTGTVGTFTYNLVNVSSSGCSQSQSGSAVVTVTPIPTATISGTTTICQNATSPNITFTGANATAPYTFTYNINGGANQTVSSGAGTTATVSVPTGTSGTFTYNLVSVSSANGCSQNQTGSATISVNPLPTATISGTTTICQNAPSPTITFTGANGTTPYTFTYNINGGANQTVSSGAGTTATVAVSTGTAGTFTYNLVSVSGGNGCSQTQTGSAIVTVTPLPTATVSGTTTICQNGTSPVITFTGANGTAPYTFTYTINGGANQTVASGAGSTATVNAPTGTAGTFTYNLISVSSANGCSQNQSGSAVITVTPLPTATISGTTTVCQNAPSPVITFTGANGTAPYTFTYSINGGANQTVSSGAGTTATVTVPTGTTGTFTYDLVSVSSANGCSQAQTGSAVITINPLPTATISGTITVCQNDPSPVITFTGANGTAPYTFTYNINGGANQTISSGAGTTATVTVPAGTSGTFTYNLVSVSGANGCSQSQTGSAIVTVTPLPTATISGTSVICVNGPQPVITFTGANGTAPYTFTYNINGGANQTISSGAGTTATVNAPTGTAGTFTYNLVSVASGNGCSQAQTGSAVVTVGPLPTATISGTTTVCQNAASPVVTLTGANGVAPYTFTYTINGGASQTASSGSGSTATLNAPTGTVGVFTYDLVNISGSNGCNQNQTGSAIITINPLPTATISGTATVCQNAAQPVVTFTGANGTAPYTFTYNINGGTNQTVSSGAGSTATVNAPTGTAGTYTYNLISVSSANSCSQAQTGSVVITVNPLPTATISGTASVCQNGTGPTLTFTGANGTAPYTFTYNVNGGPSQTVVSSAGGTATVTAATTTAGTYTYNLMSVSGANGCSQPQTGSAVITVDPLPTATIAGTVTVCANALSPTVTFTGANGTAPYTFTYSINGGGAQTIVSAANGVATVTVPTGSPGTYTYDLIDVTSSIGCSQTQTGSAVVTVAPLPQGTIVGTTTVCQNDPSPAVTFTGSNDIPTYTFTYNLNGGGSQTISSGAGSIATLNAPTTAAGSFVYTLTAVQGGNGCSQTLNQVITINVIATPVATIAGSTTICEGASAVLTITGTPNATVTYSDGTNTGSLVLDGTGSGTISTGPLAATTTYTLQSVQTPAPANCSATLNSSATITVNPIPVADPMANIFVCVGQSVNVPAFVSTPANATIGWSNSNPNIGLPAMGVGNITSFTGQNSGTSANAAVITYAPTLNGCNGAPQTFSITVNPVPVANAGSDVSACVNSGSPTIGSPATVGNTYQWTPTTGLNSGTGAMPTVSTATAGTTNYQLTVTSAAGCTATDNVTVTINPLPAVSFIADKRVGCAPLEVTFTNTSGSSSNCVWDIEGVGVVNGCGPITVVYDNPGVFDVSLTITDNNGCTNSLSEDDYITVYPHVDAAFDVDAIEHSILNPIFHFTNTSENATSYQWSFGDGETSAVTNPTHTYAYEEGVYTVTLVADNQYGCPDTARVTISVKPELIFYVPNAFTPDGDEYNNFFFPVFSAGFDPYNYTLLIFNRWGEIIFESHNTEQGWDGTYHNEMCKEGVYTWKIIIKEKSVDRFHEYVGHVTLLK